jgi:hypothetical protein
MATFAERMKSAWNAFTSQLEDGYQTEPSAAFYGGSGISIRPDRPRMRISSERTIISSIYTRMSIDVASIEIRHTKHDDSDRYLSDIKSGLNECLTVEANLDQAARAFRQDIALTMFDKGVAAVVPVDTTMDPRISGGYDIKTMRVGDIVQWYPNHVRVSLYNERVGVRQEIVLEKRNVAIVENPLYSVMNEPNSTLQRLMAKLRLLDSVDEASSSGKLDLIIQLPYVIKSEARRQQADERRKEIEFQLKGSQYGIAYTDGTEKITQLNRPAENNLLEQITTLTNLLYVQLGLTPEVMNGTANEAAMLNYHNRTIEPLTAAIVEAMKRTFLTKTARSQGQSIDAFRDPFKLVPMSDMAEMTDKFARNEVFSSNELRQFMGVKPSQDPKADQLINSNMPQSDTGVPIPGGATPPSTDPSAAPVAVPDSPPDTSAFDNVDNAVHSAFVSLGAPPPTNVPDAPSPGLGDLDPDVTLSALDELDASIDQAFSGLGLDDAAP